jgi:hypothetical protein
MSSQSSVPRLINVKLTRTPIGGWTAASPDLPGFVVVSNNEHSLRALIGEQIASACRAQGFEVDTGPVGNPDNNTVVWSITIRNAIQPTGPTKVGGTEFFEDARNAERSR